MQGQSATWRHPLFGFTRSLSQPAQQSGKRVDEGGRENKRRGEAGKEKGTRSHFPWSSKPQDAHLVSGPSFCAAQGKGKGKGQVL